MGVVRRVLREIQPWGEAGWYMIPLVLFGIVLILPIVLAVLALFDAVAWFAVHP